ncbi:hypothetical protein D3C85_379830 [compost metagenome]
MGEIADDLIDRMMDDGYFPSQSFMPRGSNRTRGYDTKIQPKKKSDPNDRSTWKSRDYPEKTFDMGFFPTIPKKEPKPEPVVTPPKPSVWDFTDEDAPF